MKKFLCTFFLCMLTAVTLAASARAAENIIKVGLCYGDSALASAKLENSSGYDLGWFEEGTRMFHSMTHVEEERLTVRSDGSGIVVSATDTGKLLYTSDGSGGRDLGIMPDGQGRKAQTRFQDNRWYGGFEFRRGTGGRIEVINVLPATVARSSAC